MTRSSWGKKKIRLGVGIILALLACHAIPEYCSAAVQGEAGSHFSFLFDNMSWLLFMAAFIGIFVGGVLRRTEPFIDGNKVWRHDRGQFCLTGPTHLVVFCFC